LILEIGCGERRDFPDSLGLDIRKTTKVDVIGDARSLPFKDESFDHVFSSHTLEHLPHGDCDRVLREWIRVLRPGGVIELRMPDLRARALIFALNPTIRSMRMIYGEQDYEENYHKSGYSYGLLKGMLRAVGVVKVKRVISGYRGIPFLPSCLHVRGFKRG